MEEIQKHTQEVSTIMEAYKQEFIEFMVDSQVLKFGEFTLKAEENLLFL